jgi:hypothetical protein
VAAASLPDRHGYFSLGTNADYVTALIGRAPFFLEANPHMPRTRGENQLHMSQVAGWCHDRDLVVLVEVHSHYLHQVEMARQVDFVYDFALPPLILHALTAADA